MTTRRRLAAIEAAAQRALDEVGIDRLPVDPVAIAERYGIIVRWGPVRGYAAAIIRVGETFGILCSDIADPPTQRFSIAHELAHFLLDGHVEGAVGPDLSRDGANHSEVRRLEREADAFAAALLMPSDLCLDGLVRFADPAAAIRGLASKAVTSLTSAALRATQLTDERLCVALSQDGVVTAFFQSRAARALGPSWGSLLGGRIQELRRSDGASDGWRAASEVWAGAMPGVDMREQVVQVGSRAFLTILSPDPRRAGVPRTA